MKFKYKALTAFTLAAIFLLTVQCVLQFTQSYKFVGFVKRDSTTWVGIAETAEANNYNLNEELDQCKKDKATAMKAANPDVYDR